MVKGWIEKPLGDCLDKIVGGGTPSRIVAKFWGGNIPWATVKDFATFDEKTTQEYITESGLKSSASHLIPKGTLITSTRMGLGRIVAYAVDVAINQDLKALFINDNTDRKFIRHWFIHNSKAIEELGTGSTVKGIRLEQLKEFSIAIPNDKTEQAVIAEVLSDMDEYILSLEKLIAKKKDIKKGAMQNLLTGKVRLPEFTGEWQNYEVGEIGGFYSGLTGKTAQDFGVGTAKYITFLNVLSNIVIDTDILQRVTVGSLEQQNAVQRGDLFFNTSSETPEEVGMCAVLQEEIENTYLNSFCFGYRLITDEIDPLFISCLFNSAVGREIMRTLAQGATRYNLSKSYFEKAIIIVPSIKEQTAIAAVLSDMDNEIESLTAKLNKARFVKQGAMQQLLTGKIRLAESAAAEQATIKTVATAKPAHNKEFEDAIIIAAIVNGLYNPKFPLGRVKVTKLRYLFDRKRGSDVSAYMEKAAGPYDPSVRYSGGEAIAQRNGYITVTQTKGKGASFGIGTKINGIESYIDNWGIRAAVEWVINGFKFWKTEDLEVLATVDNARIKIEKQGQTATVKSVIAYIENSDEWKAKRNRESFADEVIEAALKQSRELFGGIKGDE